MFPACTRRVEIELRLVNHMWWARPAERKRSVGSSADCNLNMRGGESLADDLNGTGYCKR